MVHTGCEMWQQMEFFDTWHATSTSDNKAILADTILRPLKELPLYHMKDMSLPELGDTDETLSLIHI
eukprot:10694486-Karenia_brevis.AAC.1